jgi:hypothetical protein
LKFDFQTGVLDSQNHDVLDAYVAYFVLQDKVLRLRELAKDNAKTHKKRLEDILKIKKRRDAWRMNLCRVADERDRCIKQFSVYVFKSNKFKPAIAHYQDKIKIAEKQKIFAKLDRDRLQTKIWGHRCHADGNYWYGFFFLVVSNSRGANYQSRRMMLVVKRSSTHPFRFTLLIFCCIATAKKKEEEEKKKKKLQLNVENLSRQQTALVSQ